MFPDKRVCGRVYGRVCGRSDPNRKTTPADTRSPGSVKGSARAVSLRIRDPPLARCKPADSRQARTRIGRNASPSFRGRRPVNIRTQGSQLADPVPITSSDIGEKTRNSRISPFLTVQTPRFKGLNRNRQVKRREQLSFPCLLHKTILFCIKKSRPTVSNSLWNSSSFVHARSCGIVSPALAIVRRISSGTGARNSLPSGSRMRHAWSS